MQKNECHFGSGEFEVPMVLSNGNCYMDLELWRGSRLNLETPQVCITTFRQSVQSHFIEHSFKTTSFSLPFLGKIAEIMHFKNPLW